MRQCLLRSRLRSALAGILLVMFLPGSAALSDGHRMLSFCEPGSMDIVVSYVAGALERADKDVESLLLKLQESLERQDSSSRGLKVAWSTIQGYCAPEGEVAHEAAGIFCRYLLLCPSERKKSNADLLDLALRKAWSCSERAKP